MFELGEIKRAKDIGLKVANGYRKYIRVQCPRCKEERWVRMERGITDSEICQKCELSKSGAENHRWKGGRGVWGHGYIGIKLFPDDFFFPMVDCKGYVGEHRLIMANSLGRCLQRWEFVHHKNGIRDDNRIENLILTTKGNHISDHNKGYQDGYQRGLVDGRSAQVRQLLLRIKELESAKL